MSINLNLLPTEPRRRLDPFAAFLLVALLLANGGFVLYGSHLQARVERERAAMESAEREIEQIEATLPHLEALKSDCQRLREEIRLVGRLLDDPLRHAGLLVEVGRVLPGSVWLSSLAVEPGSQTVVLSGTAAGSDGRPPLATLAAVLEALAGSSRFGEASLQSATRATGTETAVSFRIEAHYTEGGEAP